MDDKNFIPPTILSVATLAVIIATYIYFYFSPKSGHIRLSSPDKSLIIHFFLKHGKPVYNVLYRNDTLIRNSELGLSLKDTLSLSGNFEILSNVHFPIKEVWKPLWGEKNKILNQYQEAEIKLRQKGKHGLWLNLYFRAYNDGIAFRYELPKQSGIKDFAITDEKTEFNLTGNHFAWWQQANYVSNQLLYNSSTLSQVDSIVKNKLIKGSDELYIENVAENKIAFNTPITMKTRKGIYLSFHEASLTDYAGMTLSLHKKAGKYSLQSDLVPWPDSVKVYGSTPFRTPWRTIQVARNPDNLIESTLIANLNEPSSIPDDTAWCKPVKYIGIWWGYHMGKWSWSPGHTTLPHGATTQHVKQYIDFAATNGFGGVLVEGWNDFKDKKTVSSSDLADCPSYPRDYTKPHNDFNFFEVAHYAREKNIQLIVHNETMGCVENYEKQLEKAFRLYDSLGIHYVKTGYSSFLQNKRYFHHSQYAVRHYTKVMKLAAKYKINLLLYESDKNTGLRRTYPNMFSRGTVRGNAYNAYRNSKGNPPEHETIIPFTTQLAGPVDYNPGIFNLTFEKHTNNERRIHTTKAKQLALYVVFHSPATMAADLIENYKNDTAFKFIKDIPLKWDNTRGLDSEIGDYVTIARKSGNEWFVASITDENSREIKIPLSFLEKRKRYTAEIFADDETTDLKTNPAKLKIERKKVTKYTVLKAHLKESGGIAIRLKPL